MVGTSRAMQVRAACREGKHVQTDTGWQTGKLKPSKAPVFAKPLPTRHGWSWRSLQLSGATGENYVLLIRCAPDFGKWQAWIMSRQRPGTAELIARIEDQPGRSGLHVHADCWSAAPTCGPDGIDRGARIPPHDREHRRVVEWTEASFFAEACRMLRIELPPADRQGAFEL